MLTMEKMEAMETPVLIYSIVFLLYIQYFYCIIIFLVVINSCNKPVFQHNFLLHLHSCIKSLISRMKCLLELIKLELIRSHRHISVLKKLCGY